MSTGASGPPPPQPFYQPGGYPSAPPYVRQDAQGATAAMVLGIVSIAALPLICCCGIGELLALPAGIIAVILGFNARSKVAASRGTLGGDGKALAGIVMGATAAAIGLVLFVVYSLLFGLGTSGILNNLPGPTPSR